MHLLYVHFQWVQDRLYFIAGIDYPFESLLAHVLVAREVGGVYDVCIGRKELRVVNDIDGMIMRIMRIIMIIGCLAQLFTNNPFKVAFA